jgi:formylglycine-generating enzyme
MIRTYKTQAHTNSRSIALTPHTNIELVFVEGTDKFMMGGETTFGGSKPIHPVALSDFWIGKYPVTQAQWRAVLEEANHRGIKHSLDLDPAYFKSPQRPIEHVSWNDCMAWIEVLNQLSPKVPLGNEGAFSLPSEAQWEYAAQGGVSWEDNFIFAGSNEINHVAWYDNNSFGQTMPVGLKMPNQLGIYDMSGNVWEWCLDAYDMAFYQQCLDWHNAQKMVKDPVCSNYSNIARRVLRGASFFYYAGYCEVRTRNYFEAVFRDFNVGFRLVVFFSVS